MSRPRLIFLWQPIGAFIKLMNFSVYNINPASPIALQFSYSIFTAYMGLKHAVLNILRKPHQNTRLRTKCDLRFEFEYMRV